MKQLVIAVIFVLILITSLVKNSTKEIEDQIFAIKENIRPLKSELEDILLEFNYLSSPEKLVQYQRQYFEKDLVKIEIMNIKEIIENNETLEIKDLIRKNSNEQ
ncbi:cell division protein FtsL [Candidatus Pelagibacter sp.]|nr:cell division protein FtsL [Candidatus Pelagibacter sp.]